MAMFAALTEWCGLKQKGCTLGLIRDSIVAVSGRICAHLDYFTGTYILPLVHGLG